MLLRVPVGRWEPGHVDQDEPDQGTREHPREKESLVRELRYVAAMYDHRGDPPDDCSAEDSELHRKQRSDEGVLDQCPFLLRSHLGLPRILAFKPQRIGDISHYTRNTKLSTKTLHFPLN